MKYQKIIIEKDFLPSRRVESEFKEFTYGGKKYFKPHLIFARNGMGKTTLANEIDEKSNVEENESIFYNSRNRPYQITNGDVIYTLKTGDDYRFTNIGNNAIFIADENVADDVKIIDMEIDRLNYELEESVKSLLRYGGTNKNPDTMLVRELPISLAVGSFNKAKRRIIIHDSPLGILKKLSSFISSSSKEYNIEKKVVLEKLKKGIENMLHREDVRVKLDFIDGLYDIFALQGINYVVAKELIDPLKDKTIYGKKISNLSDLILDLEDILITLEKLKNKLLEQITLENSNCLNIDFSTIFFDSQRLRIDGKGMIYTRGQPILFPRLSTAEKNIVTLVYSFFELEKKIKDKEPESLLVVIDDPISSTDYSNKVGLYTFFRNKVETLTNAYSETQFIICTHDEEVYYHFFTIFNDLKCYKKNTLCLELTYEGLIEREKEYNFYRQQINSIYKYALGLEPKLSLYIGNTMRRVLEAYSTFNYSLGPSEIATDQEILSKIQDETEREFLKAYMYRLILNSDSHASDRVRRSSSNFSEMFSVEEKTRTAQLLLGFLYRLDPVHIEKMIDLKQLTDEYEKKINKWSGHKKKCEERLSEQKNNIEGIKNSKQFTDDEKAQKILERTDEYNMKQHEIECLSDRIEACKTGKEMLKDGLGPSIEFWLKSIK